MGKARNRSAENYEKNVEKLTSIKERTKEAELAEKVRQLMKFSSSAQKEELLYAVQEQCIKWEGTMEGVKWIIIRNEMQKSIKKQL